MYAENSEDSQPENENVNSAVAWRNKQVVPLSAQHEVVIQHLQTLIYVHEK